MSELERLRMLVDKMRLEHADYARDAGHLLEQAEVSRDAYRDERDAIQRELDEARATLAEAEQTERELAHQHNVLFDHKCELLWLHAEAVWQRDQADAEAVMRQATLKGLTVEEGAAVLELGPPRELVIAWVDAARKMLGDAENYSETRIDFPSESFSMEIKAAGEVERYVFTVQRAGRITPHEARLRAEADRADERESRFRWAEEAAHLEAERREAVDLLVDLQVLECADDAEGKTLADLASMVRRCGWCDGTGIAHAASFGRDADGAPMTDEHKPCPEGCPMPEQVTDLVAERDDALSERDRFRGLVDHWKDGHDYAIKREDRHRVMAVDLKEELAALRASAVVLPEDWRKEAPMQITVTSGGNGGPGMRDINAAFDQHMPEASAGDDRDILVDVLANADMDWHLQHGGSGALMAALYLEHLADLLLARYDIRERGDQS